MPDTFHSPVLAGLDEDQLYLLMDRAVPRRLETGDILFLAGEEAARVYVLASGILKFTARDGEGRETILGLAVDGDLVGEVAALDDLPQPLDAIAATPCKLLGFEAELLTKLVAQSPRAAMELATSLARRTRWLAEAARERTSEEVPARLAGRLLDLAELLGRVRGEAIEIEMPLAQRDLGRLAGMCRESACKTLRDFKSKGVVDYRGRRLRILRPALLETIRCEGRGAIPSR